MSVPIFEVTSSQVTQWCQTGRLTGCIDPDLGSWIVVLFGTRFGRPLHYVHGSIFDDQQDALDYCDLMDFARIQPKFDGDLVYEIEVWHVVRERRGTFLPAREFDRVGIDLRDALRQLRVAGEIMDCGCAYCGGTNGFGSHICRGPVGYYCVCGACYSIPQLRHGMAVI